MEAATPPRVSAAGPPIHASTRFTEDRMDRDRDNKRDDDRDDDVQEDDRGTSSTSGRTGNERNAGPNDRENPRTGNHPGTRQSNKKK